MLTKDEKTLSQSSHIILDMWTEARKSSNVELAKVCHEAYDALMKVITYEDR